MIEKCYLLIVCSRSESCVALMMSAVIAGRNICLCHFCSNIECTIMFVCNYSSLTTTISLCPSPCSDPDERRNSLGLLNLMLVISKVFHSGGSVSLVGILNIEILKGPN